MPDTISVSSTQPTKLVVNGCDLLNREELSQSQNRELQRYIDANAHLLGLLNKPKDENDDPVETRKYSSLSCYSTLSAPVGSLKSSDPSIGSLTDDYGSNRSSQLLNRVNSPASSDCFRRKGVSWVDNKNKNHSQSNEQKTPNTNHASVKEPVAPYAVTKNPYGGNNNKGVGNENWGNGAQNGRDSSHSTVRPYSPSYSTSNRRRSYDYDCGTYKQPSLNHRTDSPWEIASLTSRESRSREQRGGSQTDWKGFPIPDTPLYSSLERHPYDYNRFRELHSRSYSQERDNMMKFYGYGDHKVSGIELKAKRWTGGEIITDPNFIKKSIKPRRTYYSPIGDGVVEADGIEMKFPPKDTTPYRSVRYERYVETGSPGRAGRKLIEEKWSEGGGKRENDGKNGFQGPKPGDNDGGYGGKGAVPYDNGEPRGLKDGPKDDGRLPKGTGDGGKRPNLYGDDAPWPNSKSPLGDNGLGRGPKFAGYDDDSLRPNSVLSLGTDGMPREGWTKTFIVNPRELIHQYGNETQTIIFDLEDHTPKTTTTVKERISQSPATR